MVWAGRKRDSIAGEEPKAESAQAQTLDQEAVTVRAKAEEGLRLPSGRARTRNLVLREPYICTLLSIHFTSLNKDAYTIQHTCDMVIQSPSAVYTHVPLTFSGSKKRVPRVHRLRPWRERGCGVPEPHGPCAPFHPTVGAEADAVCSCL